MPFDPEASDLTVAVVGTGTMGRGIVQVSALGGMNVIGTTAIFPIGWTHASCWQSTTACAPYPSCSCHW